MFLLQRKSRKLFADVRKKDCAVERFFNISRKKQTRVYDQPKERNDDLTIRSSQQHVSSSPQKHIVKSATLTCLVQIDV